MTEITRFDIQSALLNAIDCKDVDEALRLIERGARVCSDDDDYDEILASPGLRALVDGQKEMIRMLVAKGFDVNRRICSSPPLIWIPRRAELLFEFGANVNCLDAYGQTVLHHMVCGGWQNFDVMLKNGADPIVVNMFGETALDLAQNKRRYWIIDWLEPLTRDTAALRYVLEVAIAFAPLRMHPYDLLRILDFLPIKVGRREFKIADVPEIKKVRVLTGVQRTQNNFLRHSIDMKTQNKKTKV